MEPWGTPNVISVSFDEKCPTETKRSLFFRQDSKPCSLLLFSILSPYCVTHLTLLFNASLCIIGLKAKNSEKKTTTGQGSSTFTISEPAMMSLPLPDFWSCLSLIQQSCPGIFKQKKKHGLLSGMMSEHEKIKKSSEAFQMRHHSCLPLQPPVVSVTAADRFPINSIFIWDGWRSPGRPTPAQHQGLQTDGD